MMSKVSEDDFEELCKDAQNDRDLFPDDVRPNIRMLALRNYIEDKHAGSLKTIDSVELIPQPCDDGVRYRLKVRHRSGQVMIPSDVMAVAAMGGYSVFPQSVESDDDESDETLEYFIQR